MDAVGSSSAGQEYARPCLSPGWHNGIFIKRRAGTAAVPRCGCQADGSRSLHSGWKRSPRKNLEVTTVFRISLSLKLYSPGPKGPAAVSGLGFGRPTEDSPPSLPLRLGEPAREEVGEDGAVAELSRLDAEMSWCQLVGRLSSSPQLSAGVYELTCIASN